MERTANFTEGKILAPLLKFMLPVLCAMFLQSLYGAVDLLVVGRFAESADVSGVSTGSQILLTITNLITSFSMGITVSLGQQIGRGEAGKAGRTIGTGITLFAAAGTLLTVLIVVFAEQLSAVMHAPEEAFSVTVSYVRICGAGTLVIIAYNLLGSIFRGLGDSRTPLMSVGIACVINIIGDLVLVRGCHLGAAGAAIATVTAQLVSVAVSLLIIGRRSLPFRISRADLRPDRKILRRILLIGTPIAFQDFLVGISFLVLMAIVNSLGVVASASIGVAEKVCGFIMLVPAAFMQAMSAFVAQNIGAGKRERAQQTLKYGILVSFAFGICMFLAAFFHGDIFCGIFSKDPEVMAAGFDYLKAYAIDCLLTCFLFCFIGFYNGIGATVLVMLQGIIGAFLVRIPVAWFMSRQPEVSMFRIGLAIPCSTVLQIMICLFAFRQIWMRHGR